MLVGESTTLDLDVVQSRVVAIALVLFNFNSQGTNAVAARSNSVEPVSPASAPAVQNGAKIVSDALSAVSSKNTNC